MLFVACNIPFDVVPATPAQTLNGSPAPTDGTEGRPPPSSPFIGYRFYFDGHLPNDWYVSSRGDDGTLATGYSSLCVLSHRGDDEKVLFLLAFGVDEPERLEVAAHMSDAVWWLSHIPHPFFDANGTKKDAEMHVTPGKFPDRDSLMIFTVLRCHRDRCESSLAQSGDLANRLILRPVRADDEHVTSPSADDCGSHF